MLQDEYDELLADPGAFAIKKLLPRVARTLAPFSDLVAGAPSGLPTLANCYALPSFLGGMLCALDAVPMLENLLALAKDQEESRQAMADYVDEMTRLGFPVPYKVANIVAFDVVSDMLRGLRGSMLDMYHVPDKLLAAVEMFIPWTVDQAVFMAKQAGSAGVFLALHRGAAGFMSDEQFAKFYWPGLRAMILGLIEAGITPIPFFEGDYTSRLEHLQELPPKQVLGHFDKIDRRKAKDLLGDVMCFWGNVPTSLLCHGTPEEVKADVRELIEVFGDTGGLIIDGSVGMPDEAKPENVYAMTEAVHTWR
jgi:uroporphyrinogen-III decarboxylase